ncbi:MAG: amidohydrolase family protein, partial [Saprospiraceae bacterium]|nr:amidohydrolase family protein [Saprospiraceae bacterium]
QAGIHSNTPNPSEYSYYERDTNGNLTGHLVEQEAIKPFVDKMSQQALTASHLAKASEEVMRNYAKNGNTTIVSTGLSITDSKPLILLKHLSVDRPTLLGNLLNVIGQLPDRQPYPRHFIYIRHDTPDLLPTKIDTNNFYGIIGVKHWYDGSPYTGSMFIEKPYLTTPLTTNKLAIPPNSRGEALVTKENLKAFVKDHHEKGWQIAIHTQGDAAISNVIDVYDQLASELDFSSSRHRLEHCLLLPTSDLERMKRLNLTPSFHINHLYYYGEALYSHILGEKRTNDLLPVRSAWQQSIVPTLHADQPMFESKPFRLIQTAIERKANSGRYIAENQSIELMEAIKALTINAAWQIHKENQLGSLETGKYADFIILDQNPFELPTAQLENIKIQSTFINGNKVIQTP